MADLLLAGPILRRVTANTVCVWMVTDKKALLKLTVLQESVEIAGNDCEDIIQIEQQRCQLGTKLFVYLLQTKPNKGIQQFPYDQLLSYRIDEFQGKTAKAIDLKALKLTYCKLPNPTFFIPSQLNRLLHGSRRKPHGHVSLNDVNYDALSLADKETDLYHKSLVNRPVLLLLTGDQIYADDIANPIFALNVQKGPELLGFKEALPRPAEPGGLDPNMAQPDGRTTLAKKNAGFSSDKTANHLFRFAEYAAMYVYVFGNAPNWTPGCFQRPGGLLGFPRLGE